VRADSSQIGELKTQKVDQQLKDTSKTGFQTAENKGATTGWRSTKKGSKTPKEQLRMFKTGKAYRNNNHRL